MSVGTCSFVTTGVDLREIACPEQVRRIVGVVLDSFELLRRGLEGRKYFHRGAEIDVIINA